MKKNTCMLKTVTAGVLALAMMPLSGCQKQQQETTEAVDIAVIIKDINSAYWNPVQNACDDLKAEFGDTVNITFTGPDGESAEKQISIIEKAVSDKVDAIVLAACDPNAENETLAKATAAGIQIITIDSDVTYEGKAAYVGTMNITAGKTAARYAADLIDNEGTIGIIYHGSASTATQRRDGFIEQLKADTEPEKELAAGAGSKLNNSMSVENVQPEINENDIPANPEDASVPETPSGENYSNIKIAEALDGKSEWDTSKDQAAALIKNDNVDLIFATNSKGTWGACEAVSELIESGEIQQGQVKIVGFDYFDHNGKTAEMYLSKKILNTTLVQNPYNMGYLGVRYAVALTNGEIIPSNVDTGAVLVTSDNINDPDIQFLIKN